MIHLSLGTSLGNYRSLSQTLRDLLDTASNNDVKGNKEELPLFLTRQSHGRIKCNIDNYFVLFAITHKRAATLKKMIIIIIIIILIIAILITIATTMKIMSCR